MGGFIRVCYPNFGSGELTRTMQKQHTQNDYLIFDLTQKLYGVDARLVREIVRLPEITPMEDAPAFIMGVINLRGQVVPVLDLNSRLGRIPQKRYRLSDSIVVLEKKSTLLGLLVNEVREVTNLKDTDIDTVPSFEEFEPRRYRFIQCVAKLDDELVMLLAPQHLLHAYPQEGDTTTEDNNTDSVETLTARRQFNPDGDEREREIFRERAKRLRQRPEQQMLENLISLAIVRFNDEMLGVNLTMVTGFAKTRQVTPIPCCPSHIAGSMNLRGDILTLVNINQILGISASQDNQEIMGKIIIVQMGQMEVGVLVHEVVDILHLQQTSIATAPNAVSSLRHEHLQGAIPYHGKMLGVLNVQAILSDPSLLVNEEV